MSTDDLQWYSEVGSFLAVESILQPEKIDKGLGGIKLTEKKVKVPYVKDYDAHRGEGPTRWLKRFDMSGWGIFMAFEQEEHIGGAIVAPGMYVGDIDSRYAQLFDIRLLPENRRKGTGTLLVKTVADWTREQGCTYLKIETQNTNVPACRFYSRQGAVLGNIDEHAYHGDSGAEHEVRLVWYLEL
ncbi:GNAT family N-acetyltransferase [Chloroflexota bacterium]